jgi:hypothetical protein
MHATNSAVPVGDLDVQAYEIPVDGPDGREQDGTLTWLSEYFHIHVRIEDMAFDGVLSPSGGALPPDPARPGLGRAVKWADLEDYGVTA